MYFTLYQTYLFFIFTIHDITYHLTHLHTYTFAQLDSGSAERVSLVSPDEKNVMIVSYHDLKRCLATAFAELSAMQAHGIM